MGTFNTYGAKSKKYGGSNPVWLTVSQKERSGGTLQELPPIGTVLKAGTLVSIDEAGGIAKIVKSYSVLANVSATDTVVSVSAVGCTPLTGDVLMKAPATISGTGTGAELNNVDHSPTTGSYNLHITANSLGVLKAGDILISATNVGASAKISSIPTGITENDVRVEEGDAAATVASVFHGELMEGRIQPVPDCIKSVLPMIKFQKGI